MDSNDVSRWFGEYLDAFAACGRGESDTDSLLGYYGVPGPELHVGSLPGDILAPKARRQREQPAHRDLSGDRWRGWPPHFRAGGS